MMMTKSSLLSAASASYVMPIYMTTRKHDWDHVAGPFGEICLSVTRITETYYLQKNNSLKTVPIIGYSTGDHKTVTATLVDFFYAYHDLGDRFTDTVPLYYFEAIESVIEVLFVRLSDIADNHQQDIGFNMKYYELARKLYMIYYTFGIDAIWTWQTGAADPVTEQLAADYQTG